jgi:hypothetical protein
VIHGLVVDENDAPLPDALIRIAIPAGDMRFVDSTTNHKVVEARAGGDGKFRVELDGIEEPVQVSLDAMKPGYRRLSGTLMEGGRHAALEVRPGASAEIDLTLLPARYFAGQVVDKRGKPISKVRVRAMSRTETATGGIEITATGSDGTFEIFNFHLQPAIWGKGQSKGVVQFEHPHYIAQRLDDIYAIPEKKQDSLRIVLDSGYALSGTVVDVNGKPMANTAVTAAHSSGKGRKGTVTDAEGRFTLRGLVKGNTKLNAKALALNQRGMLPVAVNEDKSDLVLRMKTIQLPAGLKIWSVLGMRLADGNDRLQEAYDLQDASGAIVIDPGTDSDRLQIGKLETGFNFSMVGKEHVGSTREFVQQILAEAAGQIAEEYSIRVVYGFATAEMEGSNTQYLKLTGADLRELKSLLEEMPDESQ